MSFFEIFGIAVALAMDAFAVAIATGVTLKKIEFRQGFRLSFHFGLFQGLMPVLGWFLGSSIRQYVEQYAHWLAFGLLALVASNMLREAIITDEEEELESRDVTKGLSLVILSIATSIDALAVGLSMSMLDESIVLPAIIIAVVAGCFTLVGMQLGSRISNLARFSTLAEVAGGLVLWIIGLNILREAGVFHTFF